MKFKKGVELTRDSEVVKKETIIAIVLASEVFNKYYPHLEFTVTSVMDGTHSKNSLHYQGYAFDMRTWKDNRGTQLDLEDKRELAYNIAVALGGDYDVVVESTHLHVEYQPGSLIMSKGKTLAFSDVAHLERTFNDRRESIT